MRSLTAGKKMVTLRIALKGDGFDTVTGTLCSEVKLFSDTGVERG